MTHRERFVAYMTGERTDRPPYWLFWGPWASGWERWRREGMPEQFGDFDAVQKHFDADPLPLTVPVNCGPCPRLERTILEESADYVVFTDGWGIKRRDYKGGMSMSQFLEFPIKCRADWERFKAERLDPDDPRRLDGKAVAGAAGVRGEDGDCAAQGGGEGAGGAGRGGQGGGERTHGHCGHRRDS